MLREPGVELQLGGIMLLGVLVALVGAWLPFVRSWRHPGHRRFAVLGLSLFACSAAVALASLLNGSVLWSWSYSSIGLEHYTSIGLAGIRLTEVHGTAAPSVHLTVAIWWAVILLGLGVLVLVRKDPTRGALLCLKCGYDLRGSSQRCPECGVSLPLS